jgi:hypothetical protein
MQQTTCGHYQTPTSEQATLGQGSPESIEMLRGIQQTEAGATIIKISWLQV